MEIGKDIKKIKLFLSDQRVIVLTKGIIELHEGGVIITRKWTEEEITDKEYFLEDAGYTQQCIPYNSIVEWRIW